MNLARLLSASLISIPGLRPTSRDMDGSRSNQRRTSSPTPRRPNRDLLCARSGCRTGALGDLGAFAFEEADLLLEDTFFDTGEEEFEITGDGLIPGVGGIDQECGTARRCYRSHWPGSSRILVVAGLARPRTAGRAYAQTVRLGRLAGIKTHPDETPTEYISAFPPHGRAQRGRCTVWCNGTTMSVRSGQGRPRDRPFSWRTIVFGLLALTLLRFVPRGRARVRRRTADAS